jgi:glycosyltransferase involved in cell wall biosynthesis
VLFSHHNAIRFLESDKHASHADIKLAVLFERCSLRKVDSVFCPSVYMHECFRRTHRYNGPIEVFPNIMSQEIARGGGSLRLRLGLSPEDPIFYLPSGGTSVKGSAFLAEILLELGIRYSRYGVYISGKIEPDAAKALTDAPSGASIYSPGSLGREENLQLVSDCDVCITAATHESFGMAILEALFMGVPVAAFRIEAIPEIVSADTGNLVDFGDVEALCAAAADLWVKFKSGVWSKALVSKNALTRYQDATDIRYLREKFLRLMQR